MIFTQTNFEEAVWSAVTHSGLGPVSPNIVLMSWMADWSRRGWQSSSIGMTQESTSFENGNFLACNGFLCVSRWAKQRSKKGVIQSLGFYYRSSRQNDCNTEKAKKKKASKAGDLSRESATGKVYQKAGCK